MDTFEIFLVAPPGLEPLLAEEARAAGFAGVTPRPGGVAIEGGWPEVWRANLELRGAARVLARIAEFRAMHLAQLDKRARRVDWASVLRADLPVKVEASCRASRIYHAGAAAERVARALTEELGTPVTADAGLRLLVRIEDDLCTISLDTSGEPLHRRGHKQAVNPAPMRENLAALFLRDCGYDGSEAVLDPMCGAGTFVIEAAEMAAGLLPGRTRRFAFEDLPSFDAGTWSALKSRPSAPVPTVRFFGSDRDAGAIAMSRANAERAGVGASTRFDRAAISELQRPKGPPGLVIVNPPYGGRIGNRRLLFGLYATLGRVLRERFSGWRVGLITADAGLARATELDFAPPGPIVPHGGLKVRLWQTGALTAPH
mgnify:FL=1